MVTPGDHPGGITGLRRPEVWPLYGLFTRVMPEVGRTYPLPCAGAPLGLHCDSWVHTSPQSTNHQNTPTVPQGTYITPTAGFCPALGVFRAYVAWVKHRQARKRHRPTYLYLVPTQRFGAKPIYIVILGFNHLPTKVYRTRAT